MTYELYTTPSDATDVKDSAMKHLFNSGVGYEEISFRPNDPKYEGTRKFLETYKTPGMRAKLIEDRRIQFPILISRKDSKIELIAQGENILRVGPLDLYEDNW